MVRSHRCVTASLATRQGPTSRAAFQVWLAVSLLADGLAVARQFIASKITCWFHAILAGAFANKDFDRATTTASRVLQMGLILGLALAFILGIGLHFGAKIFTQDANVLQICLILGLALAFILGIGLHFGAKIFTQDANVLQICLILGLTLTFILGIGLHFGAKIFTQDANVLHLIQIGITFVVVTQPLNSLAFVFYGVNFGASDFAYSAFSMNWNGIRTLGVPKELMTAHGRHRSYSFILGLGFSGVC
ncbi:Protein DETOXIFICATION 42 [Glycine soja]